MSKPSEGSTDRLVNRVCDELEERMHETKECPAINKDCRATDNTYTKIAAFTSVGVLLLAGVPFIIAYGGTRQEVIQHTATLEKHDSKLDDIEKILPALNERLKSQVETNKSILEELKLLREDIKRSP